MLSISWQLRRLSALFVTPIGLRVRPRCSSRCFLASAAVPEGAHDHSGSHRAVRLRPYQEECVQACFDAFSAGYSRIGVSSPTGSGKTTIFLSLITRMQPPADRLHATQALVIVNSVEQAQQTARAAAAMFPELWVEVEQGKHQATGRADITIATYQTLLSPNRLEKFTPENIKAVIVDEAHHAAAPSYRHILTYFDPALVINPKVEQGQSAVPVIEDDGSLQPPPGDPLCSKLPIIGFSATFSRHDGLALGKVFQRVVYHRDFLNMVKEQWLCNVRFTLVKAKLNLDHVQVNRTTGDFNPTSLAHVINTETINKLVVNTWLDRATGRKSTLIFCVDLQHVADLTNAFRHAGIDARFIHGGMRPVERQDVMKLFRAGEFPVLVNCAVLIEGVDVPNIDCVMLCRPTRSRNLFSQMIGRGMRLSPNTGKEDCRVIDFVDSVRRVDGVVNTPTLLGLDPDELVEDASLDETEYEIPTAEDQSDSPDEAHTLTPTSVIHIDYSDPFELAGSATGSPSLPVLSRFAWVACRKDVYVLECLGKGTVKIEPDYDEETGEISVFKGYFTPTVKRHDEDETTYYKKRLIVTGERLEATVKAADMFVVKQVLPPSMLALSYRSAAWRRQPATPQQLDFLRKRLEDSRKKLTKLAETSDSIARIVSHEENLSTLTKGQAGSIMTRLRHGSQSNWERKAISKAKLVTKRIKRKEKEAHRLAKQVVRVGPLLS
ncbi:P-loop containing nucleoside triphosphate hydrolase protein [Dacryopinax primogenitus]|uniref:p-loop containing nucleoside triphosphate hydrolase protein n=1 Tax=Dacryopinax primogenitus (strain DJM 731) TaxID=1858805 RepID=M5GGM2_DACPD|nr:P-loop containing nucleoside triphosphate hydrolase protein [Dacryopinax primogenitus]EJU05733.1 P-loop containing nucleoside triphosphate hydrolase protein [Dacryopinax primogenitus]